MRILLSSSFAGGDTCCVDEPSHPKGDLVVCTKRLSRGVVASWRFSWDFGRFLAPACLGFGLSLFFKNVQTFIMHFMQQTLVSPKKAALAIGASESSLKRWIDEGLLAVERTAGGHRRIPASEVLRFARAEGLALQDPQAVGLPKPRSGVNASFGRKLYTAFVTGDGERAQALLVAAHLAGASIADLSDGPICSSFAKLGTLWKRGVAGVAIEHHATMIMSQVIETLRGLLPKISRDAPCALGGAPVGDPYLLPSALVSCLLKECGVRAINLGPHAPVEATLAAANQHRPTIVWQSVTGEGDADRLAADLQRLAQQVAPVPLMIGGRRTGDLRAKKFNARHSNIELFDNLSELANRVRLLIKP